MMEHDDLMVDTDGQCSYTGWLFGCMLLNVCHTSEQMAPFLCIQ